MHSDILGSRMKMYEKAETTRFMPLLPVCVRIDGKCFSKFTKEMNRPYDIRMTHCMERTTEMLVKDTNARVGYTQSDEITLIFYSDSFNSEIFFDGKKQKIVSVLASMATAYFNSLVPLVFRDEMSLPPALFDCRAWQVPDLVEAANVVLWRELDASKNSVSMLAQHHFSHKSLQGLSSKEMQEKLWQEKAINWNDEPDFFKRGTYFQRATTSRVLTDAEREKIPVHYRPAEDALVLRSDVVKLELPRLSTITNRVGVLFHKEEPVLKGEL